MKSIIIPKNHISFTGCNDIKDICEPLFKYLKITYFAHTVYFFKSNKVTNLITDGEVAKHWIVNQYAMPGSAQSIKSLKNGFYLAAYMGSLYPEEYLSNMRSQFNIDHLLLYVEVFNDRYEFYSFATTPDNYQIVNLYFSNMDILFNFISYYKDKAKKLIKKAKDTVVELLPRADMIVPDNKILIRNEVPGMLKNYVKINELNINNNMISISSRESECLYHISTGKTLKECANTMGISVRTVESYLDVLKSKCGIHNRSNLIDLFWQHFTIVKRI